MARPQRLLFSEELRGNCAGLTVTIKTRIDRLRELQKQAKKEQEGPPTTLFGWLERGPATTDMAKERARVEALNVVLDAKGCNLVNIDEELQKAPPPRRRQRRASSVGYQRLLRAPKPREKNPARPWPAARRRRPRPWRWRFPGDLRAGWRGTGGRRA
jgi:hypothetical protein